MLSLIGLGLYDEKDLTLRGIETAKKAKKVYIELYTSHWHGSLKRLEKIIGKKIAVLNRKDLEEESGKILDGAGKTDVAIFVQGDPLVATTHIALLLEARKKKIKTKIIHNSSIISAIGEIGLHLQKFGSTVTIPFPEKTKRTLPMSVYDAIKANRARKLHTLCLLDIDPESKRYMLPQEAVRILLEMEKKRNEKVFIEETMIIAIGKLGSEEPIIEYKSAKDMLSSYFRVYPAVMIIPGELHFTEKEFLMI